MTLGILAIDQGTSSTKAVLLDAAGDIVARASRPLRTQHPRPDWAEQDGGLILESVRGCIEDVVGTGLPISALAISNQRETIGIWDAKSGVPLAPFITWQCRRTSDLCSGLASAAKRIEDLTGLGLDPMFSATKLGWLLDHVPGARERALRGELLAGTVDSWLVWNLTGGDVHATDHSNASRTLMMNLDTLAWDPELLGIFDIPPSLLPEIRPSAGLFGNTSKGDTCLKGSVPICAVVGDSHAALFGHGFSGAGRIKATCGTGSSLMTVTEQRVVSTHGLSATIAWTRSGEALRALEGNISVSGHTLAFTTRLLGLDSEQALSDLAATVEGSEGVVMVPALAGLGAPHWIDQARGLVVGMSLGTQPAHVARAALEAVALQIHDVFMAMEADLGQRLESLSVDGGAARNDCLMQLLADVLDRPVERPEATDLSAIGAARLAASYLGVDFPPSDGGTRVFLPSMAIEGRKTLLSGWNKAITLVKQAARQS